MPYRPLSETGLKWQRRIIEEPPVEGGIGCWFVGATVTDLAVRLYLSLRVGLFPFLLRGRSSIPVPPGASSRTDDLRLKKRKIRSDGEKTVALTPWPMSYAITIHHRIPVSTELAVKGKTRFQPSFIYIDSFFSLRPRRCLRDV